MRIAVTQKDINEGDHLCRTCPIARAIQRRTKANSVLVGFAFITINDAVVHTPPKARKFILQFDLRHPVSPMHFELELPCEA